MLTGIYNRAVMYEEIEKLEKRISVTSGGMDVGLMFIDLDNFKHYNDTYGHDVGDLILKEMAFVFKEVAKDRGFVSRYGGDEYILFLQNIGDREELTARIEGFRKKIHDKAEEKRQDVHCSIGLYRVKGAGRKLAECIMISDGLLYQAKKNGKDTYVIE